MFRVDVGEDNTDVVLRTAPSSYDTYGVLMDAEGNQIAADEDGDGAFRIATTLDEGIFYASVNAIEVGAYRILGQGDPPVPTPGRDDAECEIRLNRGTGTQTVNVKLSDATDVRLPADGEQYILLDERLSGSTDFNLYRGRVDREGTVVVVSVSDFDTEAVGFTADCGDVGGVYVSDVGTLEGIDPSNLDFGFGGHPRPRRLLPCGVRVAGTLRRLRSRFQHRP